MVAVERLVEAYRAFAANGASGAPAWLKELREGGIARFSELGFPTTKQEAWRFTNVAPIAETVFNAAAVASLPPLPPEVSKGVRERARLVFVNGHFNAALSNVTTLPKGVRVLSLADALASDPDLVRPHLGTHAGSRRFAEQPFAALNTAFLRDGAFVYLPAKVVVDTPIDLVWMVVPTRGFGSPVMYPRNLIIAEREARATIRESYSIDPDGPGPVYWTNAVTEVVAADGARVDVYRTQREGWRAFHVGVTAAHQGRDSTVNLHSLAVGGALTRHDIWGTMAGPGGRLILNGLYMPAGDQHVDHHTVIDHAAPHCESHEYFNGVLDHRARGVFNGRIIVRPGAQKTDSKQTNNNLLLSGEAHADSQPQLEIYADDVKCTHGSTVGPLDPKALFYLASRGIGEDEARRLMTYGFAAEILNRMDNVQLREHADQIVRGRLAE
jgi:Fe-S cluster assembly protein SufD